MGPQLRSKEETPTPLPVYRSILLAVDSSNYSDRGIAEAMVLAQLWEAEVTGAHVYAAKMHDVRFRQMEGGLPERYREESELERQRDVHDDLITRGLSVITDSYLDQAERNCADAGIAFRRRSLEGKNYRELVKETNSGHYDLLIIGARGLGAIESSRLGTVCERVVRRATIDTLVIKEPARSIADGPIVVAVDGSAKAYGALLTALSLSRHWNAAVKVVATFDPYFHYVAFNRIAGVLSEEAGRVFRFKEQEKLHEEIIDSGLAKIYQGHLDVAESIAREHGMLVEIVLLDGKPHDAIEKYLHRVRPSLLVIGKLGIHADPELDIGGNAENLLRRVDCAVLLGQREHRPRMDIVADVTTAWTRQAEAQLQKVPSFVRNMARMAVLRYAQERGHTVITERLVDEATTMLCPSHAREAMAEIVAAYDARESRERNISFDTVAWTDAASAILDSLADASVKEKVRRRAEKKARSEDAHAVGVEHVKAFIGVQAPAGQSPAAAVHWNADALAHLMRVPEGFMPEASRKHVEDYAREQSRSEITLAVAEAALARARQRIAQAVASVSAGAQTTGTCPFDHGTQQRRAATAAAIVWDPAADARVQQVPEGFMRALTRQRVEAFARRKRVQTITPELLEAKYAEWSAGSEKHRRELPWEDSAWERVQRISAVVRGMVIKEMEHCAKELGMQTVTVEVLARARDAWSSKGTFHSDANPGQYTDN